MRILLINPPINFKKSCGEFSELMEPAPSIGLAYIAAILEKNGFDVEVIDAFTFRMDTIQIVEEVKKKDPQVVGITCLTPSAINTEQIAKRIKEYNKDVFIVLGNLHASFFAEYFLKKGVADAIAHGEGEYSILEIVKTIQEGKSLQGVKGLSFREEGEVIHNEPRAFIEDLDRLPFPAWYLFPYKKYGLLPFVTIRKPALIILTSRGCPYNCDFCSLKNMGHRYRMRSAKSVADEFEYLIENFGAKQIGFADAIFPLYEKQGMKLCEELIKRKINKRVGWICETRTDLVSENLLIAMKEAGCRRILFGIESGSQQMLDRAGKNLILNESTKAITFCCKVGIQTCGFFMLGFPGETIEMSMNTINYAKKLPLDFAKFNITVPYPGSRLYETLSSQGKIRNYDWENYTSYNPKPDEFVYIPEGRSGEELLRLQKKAILGFYLRAKIIFRHLFFIRTNLGYLIRGFNILILYLISLTIHKED